MASGQQQARLRRVLPPRIHHGSTWWRGEPPPATRTGWSEHTSASGTAPAAEDTRVGPFAPDQCRWLIAPLLEAGLDLERIRTLVFRLGFQAVVDPGRDELVDVVRSEPAEVRAAWEAMLRRMLFLGEVTG